MNLESIYNRDILIVDGLIGSGKGLIGRLLSSYPGVEQWQTKYIFETVSTLYWSKKITKDAAGIILIKAYEELYRNLPIARDMNTNFFDQSSILRDPRARYFKRIFSDAIGNPIESISTNKTLGKLLLLTHNNTQNLELLFDIFGKRLFHFWVIRQPATKLLIKEYASWSMRWSKGHGSFAVGNNESYASGLLHPRYIDFYNSSDSITKSILLIKSQIENGIDAFNLIQRTNYKDHIAVVPFEKFVTNPQKKMELFSRMIGSQPDRVTFKSMKKQKIPRKFPNSYASIKYFKTKGAISNEMTLKQVKEEALNYVRENSGSDAVKILEEAQKIFESFTEGEHKG